MDKPFSRLWLISFYQTVCKHVASKFTLTNVRHTPPKTSDSPEDIEDSIDGEFKDLFERWRKLTDEKLSEFFERSEIGESALLGKAIPHLAQVNQVN